MLGAEGLHQLDVHGLIAVGSKDAEMGLTSVKEQGKKKKKRTHIKRLLHYTIHTLN